MASLLVGGELVSRLGGEEKGWGGCWGFVLRWRWGWWMGGRGEGRGGVVGKRGERGIEGWKCTFDGEIFELVVFFEGGGGFRVFLGGRWVGGFGWLGGGGGGHCGGLVGRGGLGRGRWVL